MRIKKTILVTGGAGFIGSHLCEGLAKEGHRVISLDNYFTGSRENHVTGVEYREGHTKYIEMLVPEAPDLVYHLGEYARVEKSFEDIETVWDFNKTGTFAVLEFVRKRGSKLIYAGSSTKFADGGMGRDQSPYAWAKASNTELVRNYGNWFKIPYAITYFYNVYGGRERGTGPYATLIGIFKEQYRSGQPFTIVSPGTQLRNFTHIEDTVRGLIIVGEKGEGDEYGIGNDKGYSVLRVAELFGNEIIMLPERQGNRQTSVVDNAKLRALGWKPEKSLDEEIELFVAATPRGSRENAEKRVLVFSTTFLPVEGLAERALRELMKSVPDLSFDIVTTAFSKGMPRTESYSKNVTVYRVGIGAPIDKYLLPLLGFRKAKELSRSHRYLFVWSLLASYGAFAAIFLKEKEGMPLLITLADQRLEGISWPLRVALRFIIGKADQVHASSSEGQRHVVSIARRTHAVKSFGAGDAFANQLRFAYQRFLSGKS